MSLTDRIEAALQDSFAASVTRPPCPPRLEEAMRYAVWPGGGRVRPALCLQVATACGDTWPGLADASAAAIELLHCASLVHDDLPCFDDADARRGRPTVHRAFGEPLAVLTGDALIVLAFETMGRAGAMAPHRLPGMICALAHGVGAPRGIVAGQAWESEPRVDVATYHRAKTGALFEAACVLGALSGGGDAAAWGEVGLRIGEAYQIADDLADVLANPSTLGKPAGQDDLNHRPSAARSYGLHSAIHLLMSRIHQAETALPDCPNRATFAHWLQAVAHRLLPAELARGAEARLAS